MIRPILFALFIPILLLTAFPLLIPLPLHAQSTVRGIVTEQNSGGRPVPGVQIKALGGAPELSDNAGAFQLTFPAKKPGERVIVTDVGKRGYEIVNRDALTNWLIPADPSARTKIVMCPEGALARNILKYYDISLDALTRGYNEQQRKLKERLDRALIDASAYAAQAQALATQFQNQQRHLEELAERFARENFDDCSDVQRRAFAAFSGGDVEEALRILETVNSEDEIAKAKAQREKSDRLDREVRQMRAESDSVIHQNIRKLLFQADLYQASSRFAEAGRAHEAAALADTTDFMTIRSAADFFSTQLDMPRVQRWGTAMLAAARIPLDSAIAIEKLAWLDRSYARWADAEEKTRRAVILARRAMDEDERYGPIWVADLLNSLAEILQRSLRPLEADSCAREALAIQRALMLLDPDFYGPFIINTLLRLGDLQCVIGRCDSGETLYREALAILQTLPDSTAPYRQYEWAEAYAGLGNMYYHKKVYSQSEANCLEAVRRARIMAAANPDGYNNYLSVKLTELARTQTLIGHFDPSEAHLRETLVLLDPLAKQDPERYVPSQAVTQFEFAKLYDAWGRYDAAERACRAAIALIAPYAETNPAVYGVRPMNFLTQLATIYWHAGKLDSAEALFGEVEQAVRAAYAAQPSAILNNFLYGTAEVIYLQRPQRAIAYMKEALQLMKGLDSERMNARNAIASCSRQLAKYHIVAGKFTDAESHAREAIRYLPTSTARRYLAAALLYQGRYEEARAMYEELKDAIWRDQQTYRDAFLEDFDEFERVGVTHPDVARIRALLATNEEP